MKFPVARDITFAGFVFMQSIIFFVVSVGHLRMKASFFAFSREFSACDQQLKAVPLTEIPSKYKEFEIVRKVNECLE